ncbi:allantoinase PuuE [Bosea sp. (in: a-proteobacteria)]|uniref:allantoinase PuuE n=1 Tax=Bosea sp. (in: a-proteobacteria) TaxID=1871050 RepID=UPI00121E399F|nr:allantoinase PuuE [Bosea sp. (in: a-proteobacteria)]TAJ33592.1 MAG: allantoinase PuuE [Bosea sp. (in: a-proteobacteria)]
MTDTAYPRDMKGYGRTPPHPHWPGHARIAVQFVINYEEGGENNILHGDAASEAFLSEIVGAAPWPGQRHMNMESIYEYGSRAGYWRLWRMFTERAMPVTVFAVASALARYSEIAASMQEAGWEIATHGLKWIDYRDVPKERERADILEAIRIQTELTGARPLGCYQGRSSENTIPLTMEEGGFLYTADVYADELPYWLEGPKGPQLAVPYTLDANDMRFATPQGFNSGDQFFAYLKDSFDTLYAEGETAPKMMSIGLHCRLVGRPGRAAALARFLDYVKSHDKAWVATRLDIARHWVRHHPPAGGYRPSAVPKALFVEVFGRIWENAPWIAEAAFDAGITPAHDEAPALHAAMARIMRAGDRDRLTTLLRGHPDLAGKLAAAGEMTEESIGEQASAGLDRLTPDERTRFTALNDAYKARFGIPFIMAVKGASKADILAAFETRLKNDPEQEFETALAQVEKISLLRLRELMAGR